MNWEMRHPRATIEMLGAIPSFVTEDDPRPAREQINEAYAFAGGWDPMQGWKMTPNGEIFYPGDPPLLLIAEAKFRDELLRFYRNAWLVIIQSDDSFEIARVD